MPSLAAAGHHHLTDLAPLTGGRYFTTWHLDVPALVLVVAISVGYAAGLRRLRRRHPEQPWPRWRVAVFFAGVALVVLATQSWVGVYDMVLFWVHMIQHLTLIMFAPVLLIAGRPLTLLRDGSTDRGRQRLDRILQNRLATALTTAPVAVAAYAATIVCTHLTSLMDTIMNNAWAQQGEHLLYLVVGCLFFLLVGGDEPIRWRPSMPSRMVLLIVSMAGDTFTGIALMQSLAPIHGVARNWGLSAKDDTYLGGAIMWVGGDGLMFAIMMVVFLAWASKPQRANLGAWLEQARTTTYIDRVNPDAGTGPDANTGPDAGPTGASTSTSTRPGPDTRPDTGTGPAAGDELVSTTPDNVDDDAHLAAYNAWLSKLNQQHSEGGQRGRRR